MVLSHKRQFKSTYSICTFFQELTGQNECACPAILLNYKSKAPENKQHSVQKIQIIRGYLLSNKFEQLLIIFKNKFFIRELQISDKKSNND